MNELNKSSVPRIGMGLVALLVAVGVGLFMLKQPDTNRFRATFDFGSITTFDPGRVIVRAYYNGEDVGSRIISNALTVVSGELPEGVSPEAIQFRFYYDLHRLFEQSWAESVDTPAKDLADKIAEQAAAVLAEGKQDDAP